MSHKTAVIIPARFGSTRFPGKPLHPILGKPLIQHVWERCQLAEGIDAVIVATDDMRIAEAAFAFGAEVSMTSPEHQSGTDRCAEVAKRLRKYSHVINVQGDEPLIDPQLVAQLARALRKDKEIKMVTAATEFAAGEDVTNPNAVKVALSAEGDALYFSRAPIPFVRGDVGTVATYYRHLGIYGYKSKFLRKFVNYPPGRLEQLEQLEQLRALENGARIRVILTDSRSLGVDAPDDLPAVEQLLRER